MPRIPDPPDDQDDDQFEAPVAVGASMPSSSADVAIEDGSEAQPAQWFPEGEAGEALAQTPATPEAVERPRDELYVGIACLALAASVFLPWYRSIFQKDANGWSTGSWGPVIFFLALAGVVIVAMRRLKVPVAFPFDHSLILEGIGWVCVAMAFVKRFFPPKVSNFAYKVNTWPMLIAMFCAVAVALLGGRVSSGAPFVMRPNWFADRAGKTGAAVLAIAIILGAVFGLTLGGQSTGSASPGTSNVKQTAGFPACAKDAGFPQPAGFTATLGMEIPARGQQASSCVAAFSAPLTAQVALSRLESALNSAKWTYTISKTTAPAQFVSMILKSPRCGAITIQQTATPSSNGKKVTAKPAVQVQAYFYSHCTK